MSAVDGHVGRHLINYVLGPKGLLGTKTRILATNSIPVLYDASHISLLREGRIVEAGSLQDLLLKKNGGVAELIRTANNDGSNSDEDRKEPSTSDDAEAPPSSETKGRYFEEEVVDEEELQEEQEAVPNLAPIRPANGPIRKESMLTLRRASTASFRGPRGKLTDEEETGNKSSQTQEASEQGKVKWSVYAEYAKMSNLAAVAVYLVTLLGAQTTSIGGSVWLKEWAEVNQKYGMVRTSLRLGGLNRCVDSGIAEPRRGQVYQHLFCVWSGVRCSGSGSNSGALDILFHRGMV